MGGIRRMAAGLVAAAMVICGDPVAASFAVVEDRDAPMLAEGTVLYVGLGNEVLLVDTKDPDNITAKRVLQVSGRVADIARFRGYLAVATLGGGLVLLDTLNQLNPAVADRFTKYPNVYAIETYDDFAILGLGSSGLARVGLDTEKRDIVDLGDDPVAGQAFDLTLSNQSLYVAGGIAGLSRHYIDRNGYRSSEMEIGRRRMTNRVVSEGLLGAVFARDGVELFDVIEGNGRTKPRPLRGDTAGGSIRGGTLEESVLAVIPDSSEGVTFYDLTEPATPELLAAYRPGDEVIGAGRVDRYWAVLTSYRKLYLIQIMPPGEVEVIGEEGI